MNDNLQRYLVNVCKTQQWAKIHINKKVEIKDRINTFSILSVKQKLK